jgi:surface protein
VFAFFGLSVFDHGSFAFASCSVNCECNRCSFLVTVFEYAYAFNDDISKWNVAKVTDMSHSKSIRTLKFDLTWRELMLL